MLTLQLYDSTDNRFRRRGYAAEYCNNVFESYIFPASCAPQPNTIVTPVTSLTDIDNELQRIGGQGQRIDVLMVHSHGLPGQVWIPRYPPTLCLDATNVHVLAPACRLSIAAPAKIVFLGCNIGEGQPGEAFLRVAGAHMLGLGGGVMLAPTSVTFSAPGYFGQRVAPWGNMRLATVSPGGAVVVSTIGGIGSVLRSLPSLPSVPQGPRI